MIAADVETVEELVGTAEGLARVEAFVRTLTDEERHLLLCEKRDRGNPDSPRVRRFEALLVRAMVFVRADEPQA